MQASGLGKLVHTKMGFIDQGPRWLSGLLLISLLGDCLPPTLRPTSFPGHGKPHVGQTPAWPSPTPFREPDPLLRTIALRCHESAMEIVVLADLYGTGALIDGTYLWLGKDLPAKGGRMLAECAAVESREGEYTILAPLTDCGTQLLLTEDLLIYRNTLVYSPVNFPDGIIRMEGTEVPVECHYGREYSASSGILVPTWLPFASTQFAEDFLQFSLKLMTGDWRSERPSNIFQLLHDIHLEASVIQGNHMPLRVFIDFCMATLVPDFNADPRYTFLENGCFNDAKLTGSGSRFMPRVQDDKLQMKLEAFTFHQDPRRSIYITCLLTAEPVARSVDSVKRACSFVDGRWSSAAGLHHLCGSCGDSTGPSHPGYPGSKASSMGMWKRGTDVGTAMEKTMTLGPLVVLAAEQMGSLVRPAAEHSGTSVDTQAIIAVAGSAVDPLAVMTEAGALVDTTEMLTAELGSAVEGQAIFAQVEVPGNSTLPRTRQSGTSVDTQAIMAEAGSAVDPSADITEASALVDNLEMLAAELGSAFVEEPAILVKVEALDNSASPGPSSWANLWMPLLY
ncbi:hypothetical protein AAFF_G00237340 [Aldrovandia affinis]|uniref:Zona pellucida sperm-binding protein 3 n=1 Tax=Aldrovandia affinis TaxID=143900 RepID=A0AAD7REM0_9TELE|nr:hypothetical protein AAFF_G00237340 [Aldrovandia affinis]